MAKHASAPKASHSRRGHGIVKRLFYYAVRFSFRLLSVTVFELRCYGRYHLDFEGGALIVSSHQSHLDPVLVGVTFNERLHYVARQTLFNQRVLAIAIGLLDAIQLDRDRGGLAGLKETMKRLRGGGKVLIFPEGTRSTDGRIAALKPGFISVVRRCEVPMIPIAIAGAFQALPRHRRFPSKFPLRVAVGPVISAAQIEAMDDEQVLQLVRTRLDACFLLATAREPFLYS